MNSQSGWPVYVLLGTLSLLCLVAVRTMQPSSTVKLEDSSDWVHIDSIRPPLVAQGPSAPFTTADSRSPWNDSWSRPTEGAARPNSVPLTGAEAANVASTLPASSEGRFGGGHTTTRVVGQFAEAAHDAHMRALPRTSAWAFIAEHFDRFQFTFDRLASRSRPQARNAFRYVGDLRRDAEAWQARRREAAPSIVLNPARANVRAPKPTPAPIRLASRLRSFSVDTETLWHHWSAQLLKQTEQLRGVPSRLASFQRSHSAQPSPVETQPLAPKQSTVANADPIEPAFEIRSTRPATWPYAEHLARRIDALPKSATTDAWATATQYTLDGLSHRERLEAADVEEHLFALQDQLEHLKILIAEAPADSNPYQLRAVQYDLEKWLTIWTLVHHAECHEFVSTPTASVLTASSRPRTDLTLAIDAVDRQLSGYANGSVWREFFELDALRDWAASEYTGLGTIASVDRVLTRTEMARLTKSQRELLSSPAFRQLQTVLHRYAEPNVNLSELMYLLEVYEQKPWALIGTKVLAASRRLERSNNPYLQKLSEIIEIHYRNANVRLAISETLLNQLVPASAPMAEPVSDQVLGARVFGSSQTTNQLSIQTVPDPRHVYLRLRANGIVSSNTRATKGLFVFHNRGMGTFAAHKDILVSPETLRVNPSQVTASNQNRTLGVESDLDLFPLIGPLARTVAMQKQSEAAPLARRIVERKLASKAQERIDVEVDAKLDEAKANLEHKLLHPLDDMALALEPVNFATTNDRAIMRYRLAGTEQLSAFTSRPRAYASSVMSLQMHQSAINNCLQRLDLAGREFHIDELYAHMSETLGREIPTPEDMDPSVVLRFAPSDCIEVRFVDGSARIYLRFAELAIGRVSQWRNLTVEAQYEPRIDGIHIEFVRVPESTLALQGRNIGFRDQMAIRTIFNKVFDPSLTLGVTPKHLLTDARFENLEVSQFELRDGWVGLSVEAR